jgi:hypothetical protein
LRVQVVIIEVYLTTLSTTAAYLGTVHLHIQNNKDLWLGPFQASNTASGALFGIVIPIPEGMDIYNPENIQANCTPSSTTSTEWKVTLIGYETNQETE